MELLPLRARDYYPLLDQRQPHSLVIFTGPACGACRRLKRLLATLDAPLDGMKAYEVGAEEAPGLVEELEIFHLPALFLYARGDYHAPVHAQLRPESIAQAIVDAAQAPRQEPP